MARLARRSLVLIVSMCFLTAGFSVLGSLASPSASASDLLPYVVTGFVATPDVGATIHLTWDDVAPDDHSDGWWGWYDYYYQLFRYNPATVGWDHIASPDEVVDYWDSGIPIGVEQHYAIRVKCYYDGIPDNWYYGDYSLASATAYWTPGAPENLLAQVKFPVLIEVRYDVVLWWDLPPEWSIIDSYRIYKGTLANQLTLYDEVLPSTFYSPYSPGYADKPVDEYHSLLPGETYYYRVSAVIDGVEGPLSAVASVKIPSPHPPGSLTGTSLGNAVVLTWTIPVDPEGGILVPVDYYSVYRGSSPDSIDECIKEISSLYVYWYGKQYVDSAVTTGGTYFYQVRATGMLGTSAPSDWVSVYLPVPPKLDVTIDTCSMYFPGELVSFEVLFSLDGVPVDPTSTTAILTGFRHGPVLVDTRTRLAQGLYAFSIELPDNWGAGDNTFLVNASYETDWGVVQGSSIKCLQTGVHIEAFNAYLQMIDENIAWLSSDLGVLSFNLAALDAKVVAIDGAVATINTNVGLIKADTAVLDTKLLSISDGILTIQTSLGNLEAWLWTINAGVGQVDYTLSWIGNAVSNLTISADDINAVLTSIDGRLAAIETSIGDIQVDVADIRAQVTDINGRTARVETAIGDLDVDIRWINATLVQVFGATVKIKTTLGTIEVDKDQVDLDYIPWAADVMKETDPAMYLGMAILAMSVIAVGVLIVQGLLPSSKGSGERASLLVRSVGHSNVGVSRTRKLRAM